MLVLFVFHRWLIAVTVDTSRVLLFVACHAVDTSMRRTWHLWETTRNMCTNIKEIKYKFSVSDKLRLFIVSHGKCNDKESMFVKLLFRVVVAFFRRFVLFNQTRWDKDNQICNRHWFNHHGKIWLGQSFFLSLSQIKKNKRSCQELIK